MSNINFKYLIIVWIIIIFILSSISGNDIPKIPDFKIPHLDKIVHFTMYFTLQFLILTEYYKNYNNKYSFTKILIITTSISIMYGLVMEYLQGYLFTSRTASFYDFIANSAGAIIGTILVIFLSKKPFFIKIIKAKK